MKKLYEASRKHVIEKLKYINTLMAMVADIVKSFATIIASLVAGTTAGVTGYYEVKKIIKKGHHEYKLSEAPKPAPAPGETSAMVMQPESIEGYQFDMNTGAFAASFIMFLVIVFVKLKKNTTTK